MIYLHTIGDALIKVGDKDIRPTSPLLFAALLYLCIERGRRVPRTALQELLFPNSNERSGAHSLRQLLYKLKQLGVPIDADSYSVGLARDEVRHDALEAITAHGNRATLEKYAQGLLPNYEPAVSADLSECIDNWKSSTAAAIRQQLIAELKVCRNALRWPRVERLARILLCLDPFNEEATLALAESTALSGSKVEAIEILTHYERETGHEDLRIASSILRKRIFESVPVGKKPALYTPFVGRDDDAAAIRQHIARARTGHPSFILVAGEPGIGKSRLLDECASAATLDGLAVHVVRCRPHYGARPLGVFIELVPALLSSRGALGISPRWLAYLRQLTRHKNDTEDRAADVHDDATRKDLLVAAIRDLIDAVASEAPLLLAIEDVQWADSDSVRELSALADGNAARRLIVLCTTRAVEPVARNILQRDAVIVRRLKPLPIFHMEYLAQYLIPNKAPGDADITSWCARTAAGNALFLQMLCAHYVQTGQPFAVPPDLVSTTMSRLELLPQECRRILEFCALLGTNSTIESLRSLSEGTPLQMVNSVQYLEDEGYLQLKDGKVRLAHDLLSDCTIRLIPPVAKRVLHTTIAEFLERRYENSHDAAVLWDCAEQWLLVGQPNKAAELLKECARHALQLGRAARALTILDKATEITTSITHKRDLICEAMVAAKAAGQWYDVYRLADDLATLPAAVASRKHTLHELITIEARWFVDFVSDLSVSPLLECVRAHDAEPEHRIQAAHHLVRVAVEQADSELAATAYRAVDTLTDPRSLNYCNRAMPLSYHTLFGDRDTALSLATNLEIDAMLCDSILVQFRMLCTVGHTYLLLGELDRAIETFLTTYSKARELNLTAFEREFCCLLCLAHVMREEFKEAEVYYARLESVTMPTMALNQTLLSSGIEIALSNRDVLQARKLRARADGGFRRHRAYFRSIDVRINQLEEEFTCPDEEFSELSQLFEATKKFMCADSLAQALCEDLRRRGKASVAIDLVADYIAYSRRERSPLPPSFAVIVARCQAERGEALMTASTA